MGSGATHDSRLENRRARRAGRWFRSKQLAGPWSAASKDLPKDFAKIPDDHTKASVLASVPGTDDAKEAVIQASIPQQATVNRNTKLSVAYEGDPKFVAIEGTKTVYHCVNTTYTIFRVEKRLGARAVP